MPEENTCFNCDEFIHYHHPDNNEGELLCPDCHRAGWTAIHIEPIKLKDIPTMENDND
tara:strand:- start:1165 stop:1338 length:174 start_codon:yes stop_codon:yes gene_type:complete